MGGPLLHFHIRLYDISRDNMYLYLGQFFLKDVKICISFHRDIQIMAKMCALIIWEDRNTNILKHII
jgi:hypothetical protein